MTAAEGRPVTPSEREAGDSALAPLVPTEKADGAVVAPGELELHPATAALVDRFAVALKQKLAKAEYKYGYSDGWLADDWRDDLIAKLAEHVQKGDPRDVAAYCAFAWHHGWPTTCYPQAALPDASQVGISAPAEMKPEAQPSQASEVREALIDSIRKADVEYCQENGEPCCSEEDAWWRGHIADAILAALQPSDLVEENGRLREALDGLRRAFGDPITRRALGGHNDAQMEAMLNARAALSGAKS